MSVAAADHGYRAISGALIVVAAVLLAVLIVVVIVTLRPDVDDLDAPLMLMTFVAACAVVGTRPQCSALGAVGAAAWVLTVGDFGVKSIARR